MTTDNRTPDAPQPVPTQQGQDDQPAATSADTQPAHDPLGIDHRWSNSGDQGLT